MLLVILAALAAGSPDAATAPSAPSAPPPAVASKAKDDVVCKTEEVTGSRFPKKVCYSKAEAAERRQLEQDHLRDNQTGGLIRGH